jgi:mannose-6-phosphate isomerase-like protein (cupin superfamily)
LLVPLIPLRENEVWDPEPEKDPHSPRRTLLEIVGPADGPLVHFGGLGVRFLIDGLRSGGGFSLVEHPIEPRCLAAPMHTHEREDEYTFVLEGEVGVQVAEDVAVARPGDLVVKPRGVPHAFWNPGDVPARVLEIISPAGFERFFAELEPLITRSGGPDVGAVAALQQRYGLTMDFASVDGLVRRWGLRPPTQE